MTEIINVDFRQGFITDTTHAAKDHDDLNHSYAEYVAMCLTPSLPNQNEEILMMTLSFYKGTGLANYCYPSCPALCADPFFFIREAIEHGDRNIAISLAKRSAAEIVGETDSINQIFYHFAENLISGLVLHVAIRHPEKDHTKEQIGELLRKGYELSGFGNESLTTNEEARKLLLHSMKRNTEFGDLNGALGTPTTIAHALLRNCPKFQSSVFELALYYLRGW